MADLIEQAEAGSLPAKVEDVKVTGSEEMTQLLRLAVDKNISPEAMEKLVTLSERVADRVSEQEFARQLSDFKRVCPIIDKNSRAEIVSKRRGVKYGYTFASLDHIAEIVDPLLAARGFSYSWDCRIDAGMMTVTCTLKHRDGHKEASSFVCPTESSNPGMSEQQKSASAFSFAKRQSLTGVLGLTTTDEDRDGASGDTISEEQQADLYRMMDEVNADHAKFLKYLGVESLQDLPVEQFRSAVQALKRKAAKG